MDHEPTPVKSVRRICLLTDRNLNLGPGKTVVEQVVGADAVWVVEHATLVDSREFQHEARDAGCETVVCSFLRKSVQEIGPCRVFIGSMPTVAAASGLAVHCEQDLIRAARELRGRLSAKCVAVIHSGCLKTVTAAGVDESPVDGLSIDAMIELAVDRSRAAIVAA